MGAIRPEKAPAGPVTVRDALRSGPE
jgi:hypothetical protein